MDNTTPERVEILNEAAELIVGQRQQDYGTPEENFQRMADFANVLFRKNLESGEPLTPRQMAEFMILLKVARTVNSPTRDSYVDIAGYAGIAGELADTESSKESPVEVTNDNSTVNLVVNRNSYDPYEYEVGRKVADSLAARNYGVV